MLYLVCFAGPIVKVTIQGSFLFGCFQVYKVLKSREALSRLRDRRPSIVNTPQSPHQFFYLGMEVNSTIGSHVVTWHLTVGVQGIHLKIQKCRNLKNTLSLSDVNFIVSMCKRIEKGREQLTWSEKGIDLFVLLFVIYCQTYHGGYGIVDIEPDFFLFSGGTFTFTIIKNSFLFNLYINKVIFVFLCIELCIVLMSGPSSVQPAVSLTCFFEGDIR